MSGAPSTTKQRATVDISEGGLTASVRLRGVTAQRPITEDELLDALREAEVLINEGVEARVGELVELTIGKRAPAEPFVLAEGRAPEPPVNEKLVWDEAFHEEAAGWQEDAPVDYYSFHHIVTVAKGAVIGTLRPGVSARDGLDVRGNAIPASGSPILLTLDATVGRSRADESKLIATIDGKVCEDDHTLQIEEVLRIAEDVSFDTGNIDSNVSISIGGQIPDHFKVTSERSITVGMTVEAAKVSAGGDVVVRRGIVGRNKGLVEARGMIVAKFATDANLVADSDVKIARQLMNSQVCTGRRLEAAFANVIGGCVLAREGMTVKNLGSEAGVPTRIILGVDAGPAREVLALERRVRRSRELIERIRDMLTPLLDGSKAPTPDQQSKAEDLIAKTEEAETRVREDEAKREKLMEEIYVGDNPSIRVNGTIYARTVIRIGDRETVFRNDLKGPFVIERRKIKRVTELVTVNLLSGSVKPLTSERRSVEEILEGFELEAHRSS